MGEMGEKYSVHWEMVNLYNIFIRKSQIKNSLTRPRRRWDVNIKLELRKIFCVDTD
jgi:hypothetical protein